MSQTIDIKFRELLICGHRRAANLPIQSPHNAKPHSNKGNPVLICPSIGRCHGSTTPSKGLCPQICSRSMPAFFRPHIPTAYVLLILRWCSASPPLPLVCVCFPLMLAIQEKGCVCRISRYKRLFATYLPAPDPFDPFAILKFRPRAVITGNGCFIKSILVATWGASLLLIYPLLPYHHHHHTIIIDQHWMIIIGTMIKLVFDRRHLAHWFTVFLLSSSNWIDGIDLLHLYFLIRVHHNSE